MILFWLFLLGAAIGSFLNVCIYRMPRQESIVSPGSHCPGCNQPIAWYDNIPLISSLLLKFRCRHCQTRIKFRYWLVEGVTAGLFLALAFKYLSVGAYVTAAVFFSILLAVSITDLETELIPDALTLSGMLFGLGLSLVNPHFAGKVWYLKLSGSLLGLLTGGAVLLAVGFAGEKLFHKEAMGGGDIKLLAMSGAFLGAANTVGVFFAAPFLALPFAFLLKFVFKNERIRFGPFLAAAAVIFYLYGEEILKIYFDYIGLVPFQN